MSLISNIIKNLYYAKEYPIFLKQYYQILYLIRYMRKTNLSNDILYYPILCRKKEEGRRGYISRL